MKRILFFLIITESLFSTTFAQKEVYFSTLPLDSVKVVSMHGIETRISMQPGTYSDYLFSFPSNFEPSLYVGYFNEKRILNTWTLNASVGLYNILHKAMILEKLSNGWIVNRNGAYKYNYALNFEAGIEPRWYFGYKQRYQQGKSQLNSGWFVSFPLSFQTLLLRTPEPLLNEKWIPNSLNGSFIFNPTVGYRKALMKKLFIEGNAGFGVIFNSWISDNSYFAPPALYTNFNLRLGYCL